MSTEPTPEPLALPPSRLDRILLDLLLVRQTAALATLDETGEPAVSMVPYAVCPDSGDLLILVSGLAAHTRQLQQHPRAALLVCDSEDHAERIHALSRASLDVDALSVTTGTPEADAVAQVYLARYPAAEMLTALPDFVWWRLRPRAIRQVAGFGAARSLTGQRWQELIQQRTATATVPDPEATPD